MDVLNLDHLPRSTAYFWRTKFDRVYTLCTWGAWVRARSEDVIPTMDAVWGTTGFAAHVYRHRRTGEVRVALTSPGFGWEHYGAVEPTTRESTGNVLSGINLTGMAVNKVLSLDLTRRELGHLLEMIPVAGKYQGKFWATEEARAVLSDVRTLRDLNRPIVSSTEELIQRKVLHVLQDKSVQQAVRLLKQKAPIVEQKP